LEYSKGLYTASLFILSLSKRVEPYSPTLIV
jgi:hypothetical protein